MLWAALLAAAILAGISASSAAAADSIATEPTCCHYVPGPFSQAPGGTISLSVPALENPADENDRGIPHNVVAEADGKDGSPLFYAGLTYAGETKEVEGTEYLASGSYRFYCSIHVSPNDGPDQGMRGVLVVEGDGKPKARPQLRAVVPAQRLKRALKVGLKVRLTAVAEPVSDVTVTVKAAGKKIKVIRGVALNAGASRVVKVRVGGAKAAVKRAIKRRRAVKVQVSTTAPIPFGQPSQAKRNLR